MSTTVSGSSSKSTHVSTPPSSSPATPINNHAISNVASQMSAEHIALFGMFVNCIKAPAFLLKDMQQVDPDNMEEMDLDTSAGFMRSDEKLKAPESENIHFSLPITADDKRMKIDEIVVNRKEMVMEVLMADNPEEVVDSSSSEEEEEHGQGNQEAEAEAELHQEQVIRCPKQLSWMTTTIVVMKDINTTLSTTIRRFGARCVGKPTTLKFVITIEDIKDQLIKSYATEQQVFRHLEEIMVQILKSYPTEHQDDSFKVQELEVIVPTSEVRSSDSKEQEPSSFTSMDQSKVRLDDSEERATPTLQSLPDFSEMLEAKQSKELEE
ncbi:hypothetical protein L1987_20431 [Smallanthus sonchifolius]|uniref:Uncharacterized protein n=1 Tax=Smallanthus sonchifolius TaxID=185202 RepID=A0ACB9IS10_9ASTR|nr:hypothetical protein L1987_20431 [Smallanthus sonchifolius]